MAAKPFTEADAIADALTNTLRTLSPLRTNLYEHNEFECKIKGDVKQALTLKRGVVVSVDDSSDFKSHLVPGDVIISVNGNFMAHHSYKFSELAASKSTVTVVYLRFKVNLQDDGTLIEEEKKQKGFEYKSVEIFAIKRLPFGLALRAVAGKLYVVDVVPNSLAAMSLKIGDCIFTIQGEGFDENKARDTPMEMKGFVRLGVERPLSPEAVKAVAEKTQEATVVRDFALPNDCVGIAERGLKALKLPNPKGILKEIEAKPSTTRIEFENRLHTETDIVSDIPQDNLIKTPVRIGSLPPAAAGRLEKQFVTQNKEIVKAAEKTGKKKEEQYQPLTLDQEEQKSVCTNITPEKEMGKEANDPKEKRGPKEKREKKDATKEEGNDTREKKDSKEKKDVTMQTREDEKSKMKGKKKATGEEKHSPSDLRKNKTKTVDAKKGKKTGEELQSKDNLKKTKSYDRKKKKKTTENA